MSGLARGSCEQEPLGTAWLSLRGTSLMLGTRVGGEMLIFNGHIQAGGLETNRQNAWQDDASLGVIC